MFHGQLHFQRSVGRACSDAVFILDLRLSVLGPRGSSGNKSTGHYTQKIVTFCSVSSDARTWMKLTWSELFCRSWPVSEINLFVHNFFSKICNIMLYRRNGVLVSSDAQGKSLKKKKERKKEKDKKNEGEKITEKFTEFLARKVKLTNTSLYPLHKI